MNYIPKIVGLFVLIGICFFPYATYAGLLEPRDSGGSSSSSTTNAEKDEESDFDSFERLSKGEYSDFLSELRKMDELDVIAIPVVGVMPNQIYDSWGDPRSGGRTHEGVDIVAERGTPIVSPVDAVVTSSGSGENGGNYVYTYNPGGESFYFAHLDKIADDIEKRVFLKAGDVLGYVGDSGNAQGTTPHLHFTVYDKGAENPFPRLKSASNLLYVSALDLSEIDSQVEVIKIIQLLRQELAFLRA